MSAHRLWRRRKALCEQQRAARLRGDDVERRHVEQVVFGIDDRIRATEDLRDARDRGWCRCREWVRRNDAWPRMCVRPRGHDGRCE